MTDNHSSNSPQKLFAAKSPPELKNYARLPEIESQIEEVWQLSEAEFRARLEISNFKKENYIRAETLAFLLNFAHAEKLSEIESLICERLFVVCKNYVRKILRDRNFDDDFIEELARDVFPEIYRQIIDRQQKSYEFWEINFYPALKYFVQNYLRKNLTEYEATALFSEKSGDEEIPFEETLEANENFARDFEIRETNRKILSQMPEDLRKIFILHYRDEETQKKIAEALGISDRAVRYKLAQIKEFLSRWRKSQGESK